MKKLFCLLLATVMILGLCACGGSSGEKDNGYTASNEDVAKLDSMYAGRTAFHGQLHDHANTGGTSDGRMTLSEWKKGMELIKTDYSAILDHKQVLHMYLDEWDDTFFIGGSEAATWLTDRPETCNAFHYCMVFADPEPLEELVTEFSAFNFHVHTEGEKCPGEWHFGYPNWSVDQFKEVIQAVKDKGGLFVIPHAGGSNPNAANGMDLYITDFIGFEVFYGCNYDENKNPDTERNYKLWTELLAGGARVWCAAGHDNHWYPEAKCLSTVYSEEGIASSHITHLRVGDFSAGPVGVRMCIGDTAMGGCGSFDGQRVVFSVGDFHKDSAKEDYTYRITLLTNKGEVFSHEMNGTESMTFAVDADPEAKFYRVEVYNVTLDELTALGNPIWNAAKYE